MIMKQSLLELLSIQMGCENLSDLRYLTITQKHYLTQKLKMLSPRQEDQTAFAAKARLIELWSDVPKASGSGSQST